MTISKERAEELKNKLFVRLCDDLEKLRHAIIEDAEKEEPLDYLFEYISFLKKDLRACRGYSSSDSYVYIDFPLSIREFTEEELKYLKFYDNNVFYVEQLKKEYMGD